MTKKFQFISEIDQAAGVSRIKYQIFEVELGFERASILIPFDRVDEFQAAVSAARPKSMSTLSQLVVSHGGIVE